MIAGMMRIQRARDASMAKAPLGASKGRGGVLIAGTGHTRLDRGAGRDLRARDPGRPVKSVAFAEVDRQKTDPATYATRWNAKTLPFDFVWFTPRANDDDPCGPAGPPHRPQ